MIYTADQMITGDGVTVIPQGAVRVDSNGTILAAGTREELTRQFPEEKVLAFNGCSPVSYTHLDVYKRQVQGSSL